MDTVRVFQEGSSGTVRYDGKRMRGYWPHFKPIEVENPILASNLTMAEARELVKRWNAYPELLKMLTEVADFWAGGDAPPELWEAITSTIAKATQP